MVNYYDECFIAIILRGIRTMLNRGVHARCGVVRENNWYNSFNGDQKYSQILIAEKEEKIESEGEGFRLKKRERKGEGKAHTGRRPLSLLLRRRSMLYEDAWNGLVWGFSDFTG